MRSHPTRHDDGRPSRFASRDRARYVRPPNSRQCRSCDRTDRADTSTAIHAELERARTPFPQLVQTSSSAALDQGSSARVDCRELLLHMLFGCVITRNLRLVGLLDNVRKRTPPEASQAYPLGAVRVILSK